MDLARLRLILDSSAALQGAADWQRATGQVAQSALDSAKSTATMQTALESATGTMKEQAVAATGLNAAQRTLVETAQKLEAQSALVDVQNTKAVSSFNKQAQSVRELATTMGQLELVEGNLVQSEQNLLLMQQARDSYQSKLASGVRALAAEERALAAAATKTAVSQDILTAGGSRLRMGLTSLFAQLSGTVPILDRVGGSMLAVSAGTATALAAVGVLATVAAIWHAWGVEAGDAQKEQDKLTKSLESWYATSGEGKGTKLVNEIEAERAKYAQLRAEVETPVTTTVNGIRGIGGWGFIRIIGAGLFSDASTLGSQFATEFAKSTAKIVGGITTSAAVIAAATKEFNQKTHDIFYSEFNKTIQEEADLLKYGLGNFTLVEHMYNQRAQFAQQAKDLAAVGDVSGALNMARAFHLLDDALKGLGKEDPGVRSVTDAIAKMKSEADESGKSGTIDARIDAIARSLDRLHTQGKITGAQFTQLSTELQTAGGVLQSLAYDKVSKQIGNTYDAQVALNQAARQSVGALAEQTAAEKAAHEIRQQELALGRALTESDQQRIRDTFALADATKALSGTAAIKDRADAMVAENAALRDGAQAYTEYQINLTAELEKKKALAIVDDSLRKDRLDEIERLRQASLEHERLTKAIEGSNAAAKKDAAAEASAAKKLADSMARDLAHAGAAFFENMLKNGHNAFQDLISVARQMVIRFVAELATMNLGRAIMGSASGAPQIGKITDFSTGAFSPAPSGGGIGAIGTIGAYGATALGSFGAGYGVGSLTTNKTLAALGGAASGALTGAAIGSVVPVIGTAIGAVVGGVAGLVGGLLGSASKLKQARADFATAEQGFVDNLKTYPSQAAQQFSQIEEAFKKLQDAASKAKTSVSFDAQQAKNTAEQKIRDDYTDSITQQLNALNSASGAYLNQLTAINKQYSDNVATAQALGLGESGVQQAEALRTKQLQQLKDAQDKLNRDTATSSLASYLGAAGNSNAASTVALLVQQQNDMANAVQSGASDATLAMLAIAQLFQRGQLSAQQELQKQTDALTKQTTILTAQLQTAQQALSTLSQVSDALTGYRNGLATSSLSPLSPAAQLEAARSALTTAFAAAKSGDSTAAAAFPGLANDFLQQSKNYNASSPAYAADFTTVQGMASALAGQYAQLKTTAQQTVDALTAQQTVLQQQLDALNSADTLAQATRDAVVKELTTTRDSAIASATDQLAKLDALKVGADANTIANINAQEAAIKDQRDALVKSLDSQMQTVKDTSKLGTAATVDVTSAVKDFAKLAHDEISVQLNSKALGIDMTNDWLSKILNELFNVDASVKKASGAGSDTGGSGTGKGPQITGGGGTGGVGTGGTGNFGQGGSGLLPSAAPSSFVSGGSPDLTDAIQAQTSVLIGMRADNVAIGVDTSDRLKKLEDAMDDMARSLAIALRG